MICRNRLDHIKRSAERKHYLNLFNKQKSNLQKSWHILKMVIDKRKCTPASIKFQSNGAIPPTNKNPSEYMPSTEVLFAVSSVAENEIEKIIGHLKKLIWLGRAKASNS